LAALVEPSSNRVIFTGLVLFFIILFQVIALAVTEDKKQKIFPISLAIIAAGFWLFKFGYSF